MLPLQRCIDWICGLLGLSAVRIELHPDLTGGTGEWRHVERE